MLLLKNKQLNKKCKYFKYIYNVHEYQPAKVVSNSFEAYREDWVCPIMLPL